MTTSDYFGSAPVYCRLGQHFPGLVAGFVDLVLNVAEGTLCVWATMLWASAHVMTDVVVLFAVVYVDVDAVSFVAAPVFGVVA